MAVVYKAYDNKLKREVAIKFIRLDSGEMPNRERLLHHFEREGRFLARLSHPNIVNILDVGEYRGLPFLVMEYVSAKTLKEVIREHKGPFSYEEAAHILAPIARALDYAHKNHILHRDVKPSNILFSQNGEAMLTDFGVAKLLELDETLDLTGTGVGIGTPEYMAPEQASNQDVDARADIYSLGVIFYELVTGRKPFEADTPLAVAVKHVNDPLPKPSLFVPNLPREVESILIKALAKDPAERFAGMADFANLLEGIAGGELPRDNQFSQKEKPEKQIFAPLSNPGRQKRKLLPITLAAVILIGIVLTFIFFLAPDRLDSAPTQPEAAALADTQTPQNLVESTSTATSTLSPTPEPSFTPTQTVTASPTPLPQPITVDNISQLAELDKFDLSRVEEGQQKNKSIQEILLSQDGSTMALQTSENYIEIWDYQNQTFLYELEISDEPSFLFTISHNNNFLVLVKNNTFEFEKKEIQLLDLAEGSQIFSFEIEGQNIIPSIAFSPDDDRLAASICYGSNNFIRVWDTKSGNIIQDINGGTGLLANLQYSPDGSQLTAFEGSGKIKFWNSLTGNLENSFSFSSFSFTSLKLSPSGETFIVMTNSSELQYWKISEKNLNFTIQEENLIYNSSTGLLEIAGVFSKNGQLFAFYNGNGDTTIIDLSNGSIITKLEHQKCITFTPDGYYLLCSSENNAELSLIGVP